MEWPFVYGHIATATGWTFPEIDQLTLWEANDLFSYWQDYPPTHVLVAAYLLPEKRRSTGAEKGAGSKSMEEMRRAVEMAGGSFKGPLPAIYRTGKT